MVGIKIEHILFGKEINFYLNFRKNQMLTVVVDRSFQIDQPDMMCNTIRDCFY